MTKNKPTILDKALQEMRSEKNAQINTNFLKEWRPYPELSKKVENAIFRHFYNKTYQFQPTHEEASKRPFKPMTYTKINETLGFAYTSTSDFAAYWVCNSGYLWATPTHHFIGFAINELGEVVGIADDYKENSIYILLK